MVFQLKLEAKLCKQELEKKTFTFFSSILLIDSKFLFFNSDSRPTKNNNQVIETKRFEFAKHTPQLFEAAIELSLTDLEHLRNLISGGSSIIKILLNSFHDLPQVPMSYHHLHLRDGGRSVESLSAAASCNGLRPHGRPEIRPGPDLGPRLHILLHPIIIVIG